MRDKFRMVRVDHKEFVSGGSHVIPQIAARDRWETKFCTEKVKLGKGWQSNGRDSVSIRCLCRSVLAWWRCDMEFRNSSGRLQEHWQVSHHYGYFSIGPVAWKPTIAKEMPKYSANATPGPLNRTVLMISDGCA